LERVVKLFLGINNIKKCVMFPRDPKRLTPWVGCLLKMR
jgi:aspartyl/asparaginyl-tRNA synthetase